jgi:hypothetical protein
MNVWNYILLLSIFIWGAIGIERVFKDQNGFSRREIFFLQKLFAFHLLVSIFFSFYVLKEGGDAKAYWFISSRFGTDRPWAEYYRTGTYFMLFLTYPLVKYLDINFYVGGLLFGTIGFFSFIYLYIIIRRFVKKPIRHKSIYLFPLILYLPNLHFWSSGIGKDALTTFSIMLYFHSLLNIRRKWVWGLFALVLAYHIRPHIVMFLIASTFFALIIDGKMKKSLKVGLTILMIVGGTLLFENVLAFLKIDEISTESIGQYSDSRTASLSKNSGSAVDMGGYPIPFKIFTFLYRPLFVDINGVMAVFSSFENVFLLWLTFLLFKWRPYAAFKAAPMPIKSIVFFFLITTLAFSMTLSNLGIMLRQKTPTILCLLVFVFWCFTYVENVKAKLARKIEGDTN